MVGKDVISEDGLLKGTIIKQFQFGTEPSVRIWWEDWGGETS